MNDNFDKCLALVLKSEGNFVDNKNDPGGMTNLGVTKAVWEEWVGHPVDEKAMRELTPEAVAPMYKAKYWMACYAPQVKAGLDYLLFDFAVNSGPGRSVKVLQEALGCVPDGMIGPRTMQLIDQKDTKELIELFSARKIAFYEGLKTFPIFGKGWLARVETVKKAALEMVNS